VDIQKHAIADVNLFSQGSEAAMKKEQLNELLYQALETEMGGVEVLQS
jgi:hypothetical protein